MSPSHTADVTDRDRRRERLLELDIRAQPDDCSCGPTCLHAVYRYLERRVPLETLIAAVNKLEDGGTLAVYLGVDALSRGLSARLYSYDLRVFDPSWRGLEPPALCERLRAQLQYKKGKRFTESSEAYIRFLEMGGEIAFDDLTPGLLDRLLDADLPVLTGLSATYLYDTRREWTDRRNRAHSDDLRGEPVGHFVVLCGRDGGRVRVADPYFENPLGAGHSYDVEVQRLIRAILLGAVTYDANLLVISAGALP